jgi:hypothetical protein
MGIAVPFRPRARAFEYEVVALLMAAFPHGWIQHDVYAGQEQIDAVAILPQGIFAIECKAYAGYIYGDPNNPWIAVNEKREVMIEPRPRNPYRQALAKAFGVRMYSREPCT